MSEINDAEEVDLVEINDILQDMNELIENLVESLNASKNRKEALFWRLQIVKLERNCPISLKNHDDVDVFLLLKQRS